MSQTTTAPARSRRPGWLIPLAVIAAILLLIAIPVIGSYNGLVTKRNEVRQQFANVDVQLQRRNDLIPNLVNAAKAALGQEQQVFGEIADARTRYAGAQDNNEKIEASNQMSGALSRLLVIVEQYPQLQSNQNIRDLMTQLEGTENRISQERRIYNEKATEYNTKIEKFPTNIAAGIFNFDPAKLVEATPEARTVPNADLGVNPVSPTTSAAAGAATTAAPAPSTTAAPTATTAAQPTTSTVG